jgi:hypothetical protein
MLATMLFELPFTMQAIRAILLATSPLLANEIDELVLNGLFSILIRRSMIRRRYYRVMRRRSIGIIIEDIGYSSIWRRIGPYLYS